MKAVYEDHFGDDLKVVNMARVSFDKISEADYYYQTSLYKFTEDNIIDVLIPYLKTGDRNLISYLAKGYRKGEWNDLMNLLAGEDSNSHVEEIVNKIKGTATHWAPFSHCSVTMKMEAPVPIRTQCFKHKVGFQESEESRRYISSRPSLFIPEYFAHRPNDIKQGASNEAHPLSNKYLEQYKDHCNKAIDLYMEMVTEVQDEEGNIIHPSVAPEQARFILPQGVEVNWFWTGTLPAWARYYNQRIDSHAQKESRNLVVQVGSIIYSLFPESWTALTGK